MNSFVMFNLGFIYDGLSRYQEAADAYESLLKLYPEDLGTYYNLTLSYHNLGNLHHQVLTAERGLPYFEKYVRLHPDDQTKWTNYSVLLLYAGREAESKREMESLLLFPGIDGITCYNCAYSFLLMKDHQRALELLDRASDLGFARIELLENDSDFEPLRDTEAWKRIMRKVETNIAKKAAKIANG
jgi:adenylate cyclase